MLSNKLSKLRARGPAYLYELLPPVPNRAITEFEEKHSIELPNDYRRFLAEIGNGGAGPAYGVFSLGEFSDRHNDVNRVGTLSEPFVHREPWNNLALRVEKATEYFSTKQVDGSFPICHEGCGYHYLLVVCGPERGHIWLDGRVSDQGIAPVSKKDQTRLTFFDWYNNWLDACLSQVG